MDDLFRDEYFPDVMKKRSFFEGDQLGGRKTSISPYPVGQACYVTGVAGQILV